MPTDFEIEARRALILAMAAPVLLERASRAYGGRLVLMKGPEAAAWHPVPSDRYFRDLDLLADDASAAQRALIRAGFMELGNPGSYSSAQHLAPLVWPGCPLVLELHRRPVCPSWLPSPDVDDVFQSAVPSATGVPGLLAPDPQLHALLLMAHSWTHRPLSRLLDLLDLAAVVGAGEPDRADEIAGRWGWRGAWRLALMFVDAVLGDVRLPIHIGLWARYLRTGREPTVLESHLARIAVPACALPRSRTPGVIAGAMRATASRRDGESWAQKFDRARLAARHALMAQSRHDRSLIARDHR